MAEKIVLFEANVNVEQSIQDTLKLKQSLEDLKNSAKSAKEKHGELSTEYIKYQAAIKATQAEISTQENLTKKLALSNSELSGTIPKLEAANAKLRLEQRGLNLETKEGLSRNSQINSTIEKNTKFINDNKDSYSRAKASVGDYYNKLGSLPGPMGGIIQGFIGMTKAAWAFIATPIGAILAAIVVAVTAVYNVFKKFEPMLEWIEQKVAAVSAVLSVLKDAFLAVFSGTKSLSESFSGLGASMKEAASRAIELKKAQQELEDQQILMIETEAKTKRQIDELLLQSKNRTLSEKERIELINKALKIEEDTYNQKKKMADNEFRIAAGNIANSMKLSNEEKENVKNNLIEKGTAYLQQLQKTKGINDKEVKAFAELSAKRETILNESIAIREKAMNRQDALAEKLAEKEAKRLEKEKAAADKKAEEDQKRLEKELSDYEKNRAASEALNEKYLEAQKQTEELRRQANLEAAEKRKQDRIDQAEWERNRLAVDYGNQMQLRMLNNESEFEMMRDDLANQTALELQEAEKSGANKILIQQKYSKAKRAIDLAEMKANADIMAQFAGNLATLFGKNTKAGKMAASAQIAIDTLKGAISAYSSLAGIPIVGPVLGAVAAAAVGVTGAKAVKDVWAVKSGLPGDSGGGGGGGSAPTPAAATPPVSVNPSIGQGIVSRNATDQPSSTTIVTQPTIVVDKVTDAQNQSNRISKTSTE